MSRRPRWAAVVTSLALLTAYGAQSLLHAEAANSQVMPDPSGDANNLVDANGGATAVPNEPRADIVQATAAYDAGAIVFSVKMAQPVNPATDAGWGASDVTWFVDTTGDKKYDASIEFGADGGKLYAEVYNPSDQQICTGAGLTPTPAIGSDQSYIVSVPPRCFGNPSGFNWGGRSEFAQGDKNIMDRFPDGDGNYFGPVTLQTTPPTSPGSTPTTRPGGTPGTTPTTPTTEPIRPIVTAPVAANEGFWLLGKDGGVFSFGTAQYFGSIGYLGGAKKIVSMAADPDGTGYWFVADDGGIFAYKAPFWGSTGNIKLTRPIVGMAPTPSGHGYWLVASDGGMFAFGDAGFYGSTGAIKLNKPIVGMTPSPTGKGYWLVASDGGIFAFGDAKFFGSTGNLVLNQPIVGMAATPTGKGYWFVAKDGGVFAFGDAGFFGSAVNGNPADVVGMSATRAGQGYRVARADGSITFFGNAAAGGGLTGTLAAPIVAIATAS